MKHNSLSAKRIIHSCYENYDFTVINLMHYLSQKISSLNFVNLSPFNCVCIYIYNLHLTS